MPIIQSASKRMRQNQTRYQRNLRYKRAMRSEVKAVNEAINAGNETEARSRQQSAQKAIDKAVKRGIIHRNTANRKKSQLTRRIEQAFSDEKTASATKAPSSNKQSATTKRSRRSTQKKSAGTKSS